MWVKIRAQQHWFLALGTLAMAVGVWAMAVSAVLPPILNDLRLATSGVEAKRARVCMTVAGCATV